MLTAIGLTWTMISSKRGPSSTVYDESYTYDESGESPSTGERIKAGAQSARDRLVSSKEAVRDTMVSSKNAVRERISSTAERTQAQARRAREGFSWLVEEQPLMLGALGITLGAVIGAILPRTEQEDRLIGKVRDRTVERVKESAAGAYDRARETVKDTSQQEHAMSKQSIGGVNAERHPVA